MNSEKSKSPLRDKSYAFAIKIVKFSQSLVSERKEYVLSSQTFRSGTAITALIRESEFAAGKADFINKLKVSLKEANETEYWLMLLHDTNFLGNENFLQLQSDCKRTYSCARFIHQNFETMKNEKRKMKNMKRQYNIDIHSSL